MRPPILPEDIHDHIAKRRSRLLASKPGRMWAKASFVSAAWSLFLAPMVFGPLGVAAGMVAFRQGDKWWGAAGVSSSVVAVVVGYYWIG